MVEAGKKGWLVAAGMAALVVLLVMLFAPAEILNLWDSGPPKLRVLFIGNAYSANDMPAMLASIADSDPMPSARLEVDSVNVDGATLTDHWQRIKARKAVEEGNWSQVVLQEQGLWAMSPENRTATTAALQNWAGAIKKAGATPVFFATWARQPGSNWYISDPLAPLLHDPFSMQQVIDLQSDQAAKAAGMTVVHVGTVWRAVGLTHPEIVLYQPDGQTPSAAGSYLTALVFYRAFTNRSPAEVPWAPAGMSDDDAKALREAAAR